MASPKKRSKKKSADDDKDPFDGKFWIPTDEHQWYQLEQEGNLMNISIHDIDKMNSGSDVLKRQFVTMRTVWPRCIPPSELGDTAKARYGLDRTWEMAEQLVSRSDEFRKYLQIVSSESSVSHLREGTNNWPGSLKPVRKFQEATFVPVMQTVPTSDAPEPSSKRRRVEKEEANDESTVVAAAILILDAFLDISHVQSTAWDLKHLQLTAKFRKAQYTAYTDGVLWAGSQIAYGILEMKKRARHTDMPSIQKQESAEMVAWLKQQPALLPILNGCRPLFAQNRDEVFATFGSYGPEYLEYLETGIRDPAAFLEMQSVGPWKAASATQMYNLACFVVSILLQIEESLQNSQF